MQNNMKFWVTRRLWLLAFTVTAGLLPLSVAQAEPFNARLFKAQFGYAPSCNGCHRDGGGSPLNTYGQQFKDARANAAAFGQIAHEDADGDGISNSDEIAAKANPGDASSTPDAPGDWLSLDKLIPTAVRDAFPGIRLYKPIDAILTDAEKSRAAAWGVTLADADENTIYVPVQDKRPVGTAIIVKGEHNGEALYLLVTTDRTLALSGIAPVHGEALPKPDDDVYQSYAGATAASLEAPKGDGLERDIALTAKRGLSIITVRLKK